MLHALLGKLILMIFLFDHPLELGFLNGFFVGFGHEELKDDFQDAEKETGDKDKKVDGICFQGILRRIDRAQYDIDDNHGDKEEDETLVQEFGRKDFFLRFPEKNSEKIEQRINQKIEA